MEQRQYYAARASRPLFAHPALMLAACLSYAGSVVLAGEVDAVSPDWFRRDEENPDSGSWQRVIDSCGGACIIMSTRPYFFTQARTRQQGAPLALGILCRCSPTQGCPVELALLAPIHAEPVNCS